MNAREARGKRRRRMILFIAASAPLSSLPSK